MKKNNLFSVLALLALLAAIPAHAYTIFSDQKVIAQFVRELHATTSKKSFEFRVAPQPNVDATTNRYQQMEDSGDPRGTAALAAMPAYLAAVKALSNVSELSDEQAMSLYKLAYPMLMADLPQDFSPLNDLQAISVSLYTDGAFAPVDGDLYAFKGRPTYFKTYIEVLDSALAALPSYTQPVYHVETQGPDDLKQLQSLQPGATEKYDTYVSTSTEPIGYVYNVRMIIQPKTAKNIVSFSLNPQEKEALIKHGVVLVVKSPASVVNGIYTIYMTEQ